MGSEATLGILFIGATFILYIVIAVTVTRSPIVTAKDFYINQNVPTVFNGMATAADWMSASTFLSVAGLVSFWGFDGVALLLGWTGGFLLLTLLIAPYIRKYNGVTVPAFLGDRFESKLIRVTAALFAIAISFIYIVGQMKGVGVVISHFSPSISVPWGIVIGMMVMFIYVAIGGMKAVTRIQIVQCFLIIFAYMLLAGTLSTQLGFNPVPQLSLGDAIGSLEQFLEKFGLPAYKEPFTHFSQWNLFFITLTLMCGTAGLPHIIIRFYTVRSVKDARWSGFYALCFIGIVYTAIPTVAALSQVGIFRTVDSINADEKQKASLKFTPDGFIIKCEEGGFGEESEGVKHFLCPNGNEIEVRTDNLILIALEFLEIPSWVIILVVGGLSAAILSTVSILLLVITSSLSHDLLRYFYPKNIDADEREKKEIKVARLSILAFIIVASWVSIVLEGDSVSELVAISFGLACSSFFPAIVLGIFDKRMNKYGVLIGMVSGFAFTATYTLMGNDWFLAIPILGIGVVGMTLNFIAAFTISQCTPKPSKTAKRFVEFIRSP